MLKKEEIRIRDPFILTDFENGCYYMYGTTALKQNSISARCSFSVYKSYDLENFEDGVVVFDGNEAGFWATHDYWAPEVHKYNGKYYLFGSCKADGKCRATQIFVSDTPDGKFIPISDKPATPLDWECLDGTLYIEDGKPYIVFCHEWLQVNDGEIWATPLSDDLSHAVGEPFMLFRASDNKDVTEIRHTGSGKYVTDGPFLFKEGGKLKMIWSSFCCGKYQVLIAESDSIKGKWEHKNPEFDFDGGHAMLFYTLDGKRIISLHAPNKSPLERAVFMPY